MTSRIWQRLWRDPLLHFCAIGVTLFAVHGLVVEDERTIVLTPGLRADLVRRFEDENGRKPNAQEFATVLRRWKRDEALFRAGQSEGIDRSDTAIRAALIAKIQARAGLEVPQREPTRGELERWLHEHRSLYETPLRYDFEFLSFPRSEPVAHETRERSLRSIAEGTNAALLGRAVVGGNLSVAEMTGRIEPKLAELIPSLPTGSWQRAETERSLLLVRVKKVEGGLPSVDQLGQRLISDWRVATRQEAVERKLDQIVETYRFEESP